MTNMRRELADTIEEFGHWVLLRKAILTKKCACIEVATEEPRPDCSNCNGTGHFYVDYLIKVRRTKMKDKPEVTTDLGKSNNPMWHFYLMHQTEPSDLDFILELELDKLTCEPTRPFKALGYFDIMSVESHRDNGGQIVYHDCQCEESTWNVLS